MRGRRYFQQEILSRRGSFGWKKKKLEELREYFGWRDFLRTRGIFCLGRGEYINFLRERWFWRLAGDFFKGGIFS